MKINCGVTSKMGNYIKAAQVNGETVFLITAKDETGDPFVYLVNGYLACKMPLGFYAGALQPYTHTDAPEEGQTKTIAGPERDARNMPAAIEKMFSDATKSAYETGFTCRTLDGKKTLDIFALEDGTPLLINHKLLEVFDWSGATIKGSFRVAPLTISGPFGVQALVLPVRIDSEREQTFEAIAAATAEKYNGKNSD